VQINNPPLAEGDTTLAPTNRAIEYTGVTSCMTLTLIYSDGTASGGHASLQLPPNKPTAKTVDQIVDELNRQATGKQVSKLIIAGELEIWEENLEMSATRYQNLPAIWTALTSRGGKQRIYDSGDDLQGKGAHMTIPPGGATIEVRDKDGNLVKTVKLAD
jgi:hypothetical protein